MSACPHCCLGLPGRLARAPASRPRCRRSLLRVRASGDSEQEEAERNKPLLVGFAGGIGGTLLAASLSALLQSNDATSWATPDTLLFGTGDAGVTPGDVTGAGLWATSLYFANPWQLLLLFLGARTFEVDRPGDDLLRALGRVTGQAVDAPEYTAPQALRVLTVVLFIAIGTAVSVGVSSSLGGEATWSVSTGLGAVCVAGVVEVGRPKQLSAQEQVALEADWQEFKAWADVHLTRKGRCHVSEVDAAYKRHSTAYRRRRAEAANSGPSGGAAADTLLRDLLSNWAPQASRSSGGFYKGIALASSSNAPVPAAASDGAPPAAARGGGQAGEL